MHGAGMGVGEHYSRKKEQQRWAEWQKKKKMMNRRACRVQL